MYLCECPNATHCTTVGRTSLRLWTAKSALYVIIVRAGVDVDAEWPCGRPVVEGGTPASGKPITTFILPYTISRDE